MQAFPGRDIMSMLVKQPRLLWCTDLPGRMEGAVGLLMRIHPSKDIDVIRDTFAEYPELLYRMVSAAVQFPRGCCDHYYNLEVLMLAGSRCKLSFQRFG